MGATDRGMSEALAGAGVSVEAEISDIEDHFLAMLGELLRAGQDAGTVRGEIGVAEVKALLVGLQAMQGYNSDAAARVIDVVLDGLRAS